MVKAGGSMERYLSKDILSLALNRHKMAFISGPRQVGKTTLAKSYLETFDQTNYHNWDESTFRRIWTKSPNSIKDRFDLTLHKEKKLLILDEIHKSKGWKQKLKGLYDELAEDIHILVTGSARLNVFKKGGDSLMGRYLSFRLHPLSYGELLTEPSKQNIKTRIASPEDWKKSLFKKQHASLPQEPLDRLLRLSGFPEPYFANSDKILRIWRNGRNEKIIREDLRDLSRLPELSQIEMLASLLPGKIGSPLSVQSLREDLEVAHDTVTRWLKYLNELFYFFEIKPWTKSIPRSLKKEGKIYLYDWTEIENEGSKFENMVACHLLKACHYWTDTGEGNFDLSYLRNKEKQEIDFLITKDGKPWLCLEAKLREKEIDNRVVNKFMSYLHCDFVQIVLPNDVWRLEKSEADTNKLIASASHVFAELP
jgi:predicted AAA+ superfamily ATPase